MLDVTGQFCYDNYLKSSTLENAKKIKIQLGQILHQTLKLTGSKRPLKRSSNDNSNNIKLMKGIICAGNR